MPSATIDDLVDEYFTQADFLRERAELAKQFLMIYGVQPGDIDDCVRNGELHETDLVARWVDLHALEPYVFPQLAVAP